MKTKKINKMGQLVELSVLVLLVTSTLASNMNYDRYDRLPQIKAQDNSDLCNHCGCEGVRIECDFRINKTLSPIWDSKYVVPKKYRSIEVHMKPELKFELRENLFNDNQVNAFRFYGSKEDDQVEVAEHAFKKNNAGYPEIEFFGLTAVFLQAQALEGDDFKVLAENCSHVVIFSKALQMSNLDLTIKQVDWFDLKQNAFHSGGTKTSTPLINLRVENSGMAQINSFNQSMNKVSFSQSRIGSIEQDAFHVTNIKELNFENNHIGTIKPGAFTDKLLSDKVSLLNNVIGTIEGEAISHSGVSSLIFTNNTVEHIRSGAIQVNAANAYILNNTVQHTEANWLTINQVAHVEINDNRFDRFDTFQIKNVSDVFNCSFLNNSLKDPQPGSLDINACRMHHIHVGRQCACDSRAWLSSLSLHHDLESEIICTLSESDTKCFNATSVNYRRYLYEACGVGRNTNVTQHCINGRWSERSISDQQSGNVWSSNGIAGCIVAFVAVMGLVVVGIALMCRKKRNNVSQTCSWTKPETDTLLKEVKNLSDQEEYKDVCKALLKLNKGTLSKTDCLNRITDTLSCLPSKSPSVIKNLLTDHLNKCHPSKFSDSQVVGSMLPPIPPPSAPSPDLRDTYDTHIYAEPQEERRLIPNSTPQQSPPEFCTHYSSPINTEDPYTEPFNAHANDIPPAYQYATPMRRLAPPRQPPSTVVKYSTPVWRSAPGATPISRPPSGASVPTASATATATDVVPPWQRHVRDLRQDLEAMPQFHPNQLTSLRNQRQVQQNYPRQQQKQEPTLQQPPPYSGSRGPGGSRSFECLDGAASLAAMEHMDSGSDHSGGSDVTVQISDVIDYADA